MSKATTFLIVSLFLLLFPIVGAAQSTSGVTGIVTDNTGAVIPGVEVKLIDLKTSKELTTKTDDQGVYNFNQVAPGQGYRLTFAITGFQTLVKDDVSLGVGRTETHNVQMIVGQISESITVTTGNADTLNTTDASIGNVIEERRLRELPIQIRSSPAALIGLQPGVVGSGLGTTTTNRVGSVTGSRADQGNITVDGIDANDQQTGQFASTVGNAPIDAIQEFRTVTTNPGASEGRSSGGQIEMVTKSGTNDFSGNVRWYNRTGATAANSFFNNRLGRNAAGNPVAPKPKLIRNQFGGSLGGPIVKDKLFFFQDYEGRRDIQEVSYLRIVPLEHFRNGGLAYLNNTANCPTNARLNTRPDCITVLTPAQVAALDPKGIGPNQALLSLIKDRYPQANDLTAGNGINTGGFRFNAPATRTDNTYVTRIDWNATNRQKLFGRFNIARSKVTDTLNTVAAMFPGDPESGLVLNRDYSWVVGHTWTPSMNLVNQLTIGVSHSGLLFSAPFQPQFPNIYGVPDASGAVTLGGRFGGTGFGIAAPFADISEQNRFVDTPTIRDDVTWSKGAHTLSFGGVYKPIKVLSGLNNDFNFIDIGIGGGLSGLDASLRPANIRPDTANSTVASTNYDAAFAFMLGRFTDVSTVFNYDATGTANPPGSGKVRNWRFNEYELYVQDNWRARNDLTLTAGLRWQYYPAPYEANGFQACNDVDFRQLLSTRFRNAGQGLIGYEQSLAAEPLTRYDLCGKANNARAFYEPDLNNFAPRLSFAWNPSFKDGVLGAILGDKKTVIRGGGSVVYDRTAGTLLFIQDQLSYLFDNSRTTNFGLSGSPTNALLNDPRFTGLGNVPVQNQAPTITRPFTPFFVDGELTGNVEAALNYSIDQQFKTPYAIQYSFGFQRELPGNFVLEASYVGRQGRQLFSQADAAQILDYKDPVSGQTLLQAFNALQVQVQAGTPGSGLTPQPFFENQMNSAFEAHFGAGANCGNIAPLYGVAAGANCTRLFTALNRNLIQVGNTADAFQGAYAQGWLNPNVGLSGQFSSNVFITNLGASSYNGMLLSLRKRFSNGLQFDLNYTWSHSIDNQSSVANTVVGGLICDVRNLRVCRGNSDFDIRHLFNANFIYELPFGRDRMFLSNSGGLVDAVVGGWTVTGIAVARSGLPFSVVSGSFPTSVYLGSGAGGAPAALVGNPTGLQGQIHDTPGGTIQFFTDSAKALEQFRVLRGGEVGNRNVLSGPGFWNVDLAVLKNFRLPWSENHRLQFRWEMFNAFNHHNFGLPNNNVTSASFGNITSSANSPREMQFAVRYEF